MCCRVLWKVWDDHSMWNRDFSELCPSFTLARLNQLEVAVLEVLRVSGGDGCTVDREENIVHQVTVF